MSSAQDYEKLIRAAFGYDPTDHSLRMIEKYEDPAGLADEDIFTDENITEIKAATSYAILIVVNDIISYSLDFDMDDDEEESRLDSYAPRVLAAADSAEVGDVIRDFEENVMDRYYEVQNDVVCLKRSAM
jgi:hypothetical protein